MSNISIFAKRSFLNTNPNNEFISKEESYKGNGHLQRVSSMIRADQIAPRIGAKVNPTSYYENDVCIYVKPMVRKGDDFNFEGKRAYLDIIDGHNLGELLKQHPNVGCIVCSVVDYETMSKAIVNKIVLIPQHHCNFERVIRNRNGLKTIGIIGTEKSFEYLPLGINQVFKNRGMELIKFSKFFSREDIIDFYLTLDLQLVWRPYEKRLSNPLKIVNAASFGVPTLALNEPAFQAEWHGAYMPVNNLDDLLLKLDILVRQYDAYERLADKCVEKAEQYHIDNIAKLYKDL